MFKFIVSRAEELTVWLSLFAMIDFERSVFCIVYFLYFILLIWFKIRIPRVIPEEKAPCGRELFPIGIVGNSRRDMLTLPN